MAKTREANNLSQSAPGSAGTPELCNDYTEEYIQNMRMDIITKRISQNSEQAAKFKQQQQICPQWRADQQTEAKKKFKLGLQEVIMNLPECQPQKRQLEAVFGQALGYPELDQEIKSGEIALGVGQRKVYCDKMTNVVSPYLKLRDLVYKCNTGKSVNISGALNETFGKLANEMRQNGCGI